MAGSANQMTEWEGGSLSDLVALLQGAAQPVRIEVIAAGAANSSVGEVHLLAGGVADAFAGSLRRDDAMAVLQGLEGARYLVESRLPDPETGSLSEPGPHQGLLKDRPLASLMRYCEDYVLTCRVEVSREQERAVITYRRGEIVGTAVGDSDASDRLPEVLAWSDGAYEILLPAPVLPQVPSSRKRDVPPVASARTVVVEAKQERKRHTTIPMMPTTNPPAANLPATSAQATSVPANQPATSAPATSVPAKPSQPPSVAAAATTPSGPSAQPAPSVPPSVPPSVHSPAPPAPFVPTAAPPPPAQPVAPARGGGAPGMPLMPMVARPPATTPAVPGKSAVATRPTPPQPALPPPTPARPPLPAGARLATAAASPKEPLQSELTRRGTPPAPGAAPLPSRPAPRTTATVGAQVPLAQSPEAVAQAKPSAPTLPQPVTLPGSAAGAPSAAMAPSAPIAPSAPVAPSILPMMPPPFQLSPATIQPAVAATLARPLRGTSIASNDLKPASGTIEAKPKHAAQHPPVSSPIEIADQPVDPAEDGAATLRGGVPARVPTPRRVRVARKALSDHSVRIYVFIGLAIGAGIVLAQWAYWYLPFGHR